jgi:galactosamine-6-phosphate isomerase
MLHVSVHPDHEAVSRHAADWLYQRLEEHPRSICCLASGNTPTRTYELLAERGAAEREALAEVRLLQLDEWGGLPRQSAATCESHLRQALVEPLGLSDRFVGFDSDPADPAAECSRVARWLEQEGPIDVCVLGLGVNGHLGFNEPAEHLQPHAHVAQLSEASLAHAMIQSLAKPPTFGMTLGMADLLQSRHVLLLVTGSGKRLPLERLLACPITTFFPASFLKLHARVQVMCDAAASGRTSGAA